MTASQTVFSIHGIRTRAAWQKAELSQILADAGFTHIPLDFGYFLALSLIIRPLREKKIRWFWDEYAKFAADLDHPPHIIAHSFGTYVVCEALRMHGEIKFDRVILCGSIVDPRYPWGHIFSQGRVSAVLNDYGSADIWAQIVGFGVSDAGPSGRHGFANVDNLPVFQRRLPGWRHSDFFNKLHFLSWLRFLKEGNPGPGGVDSNARPTWRAWTGRLVAVALAVTLCCLALLFLIRPIPLHEGLLAMQYGVLGSGGTWKTRSFEREFGDSDQPPREGDNVIALRPISAFTRVPRRLLTPQLGVATRIVPGERFRVRQLYNPVGQQVWFSGAAIPKPEGLEHYQYVYQYSYDEGCSGFLMSDSTGNWVEYTPGDDNCTKTIYPFTEVGLTREFITLYDKSGRGYYFRIPTMGGHSALAGPYLPKNLNVASLSWSRHYKVRRLRID